MTTVAIAIVVRLSAPDCGDAGIDAGRVTDAVVEAVACAAADVPDTVFAAMFEAAAAGVFTIGDPTLGELTFGESTLGESTFGESTFGESTLGESTFGEFTLGELTLGEFTFGELTLGESVFGLAVANAAPAGSAHANASATRSDTSFFCMVAPLSITVNLGYITMQIAIVNNQNAVL